MESLSFCKPKFTLCSNSQTASFSGSLLSSVMSVDQFLMTSLYHTLQISTCLYFLQHLYPQERMPQNLLRKTKPSRLSSGREIKGIKSNKIPKCSKFSCRTSGTRPSRCGRRARGHTSRPRTARGRPSHRRRRERRPGPRSRCERGCWGRATGSSPRGRR